MNGGQLDKPSTPSIDCILDIVAKKCFVIDTALAVEFQQYVRRWMTRSNEHNVERYAFIVVLKRIATKSHHFYNPEFLQLNRNGHEKLFYINAVAKGSICGTTATLSASDHPLRHMW
eukprot:705763_1